MNDASALERLRHICSHVDNGYDVPALVANILKGTGSPTGSSQLLESYCFGQGMRAWFEYGDLSAMKQWFYLAGECQVHYLTLSPDKMNLLPRVMAFSRILLSDSEPMIENFLNIDGIYDPARISSVKSIDYHAYNIVLAAKGDMDLLASRCKAVVKTPPAGNGKKYLLDNEFLAALAVGDQALMEGTLNSLVSPKVVKARASLEGGYTRDLISTSVAMYSKLAWRNGYEVDIQSNRVPAEWLPVNPLPRYIPFIEWFS